MGIGMNTPGTSLDFGNSHATGKPGNYATGAPGGTNRNDVINVWSSGESRYGLGIHTGTLEMYTAGANSLQFGSRSTDGNGTFTPQMSIGGTNGYVGIGTTTPSTNLHIYSTAGTDTGIYLQNTSTGGHNWNLLSTGSGSSVSAGKFAISDNLNPRLVIDTNGNVGIGTSYPSYQLQLSTDSAAKPGTSTWTIASDERLKDIRAKFRRGLAELDRIQPIYFRYKEGNALDLPSTQEFVGIRAQEVQKAVPEAVSIDDKGYLHVTNDAVIWTAVNAIKELYHRWMEDSEALHRAQEGQGRALASLSEENARLKADVAKLKAKDEARAKEAAEMKARLERLEKLLQAPAKK